MDKIFENGRVSGDEPMAHPPGPRSLLEHPTLERRGKPADHMRRVANLTIYYTRDLPAAPSFEGYGAIEDDAVLLIPGAETAEFFQYNGPGFQETELTRLPGVGFIWLLTGYKGCVVHEHQDGAASGKNNRIATITGVIDCGLRCD